MNTDFFFRCIESETERHPALNTFRIVRREAEPYFDYGLVVMESPALKIRFTLEKGLAVMSVGSVTASADWSRESWFSMNTLTDFLETHEPDQSQPTVIACLRRMRLRLSKLLSGAGRVTSITCEVADDEASIRRQVAEQIRRYVESSSRIERLLRADAGPEVMDLLAHFRERRSEELLERMCGESSSRRAAEPRSRIRMNKHMQRPEFTTQRLESVVRQMVLRSAVLAVVVGISVAVTTVVARTLGCRSLGVCAVLVVLQMDRAYAGI